MGHAPFAFQDRRKISREYLESAGLVDGDSASKRKRGVGYADHRSNAEAWDASKHEVKQHEETKKLEVQFDILTALLLRDRAAAFDDADPLQFVELFSSSSLIPILDMHLCNDSFTDMCKKAALYVSILKLLRAIMQWPCLHDVLMKLRGSISGYGFEILMTYL